MFDNEPGKPGETPPTGADSRSGWLMTAPVSTVEDVAVPPNMAPVARVQTTRRFGVKWVVGLLVVAVVATAALAGARLLTTQSSGSHLTGWAPVDSVLYVEGNLTVTGDQHAKLGAFLAHFPAFGSASDLDARLTEAYDKLVRLLTKDKHDYSTEIKPWFTGAVAVAITRLPDSTGPQSPGVLLVAGVTDPTAAGAWLKKILAESGTNLEPGTYGKVDLLSAGSGSIAVLPDVFLLGDTPSVKAAIDQNGKGGLASGAAFSAAASAIDRDGLLSYYVDGKRYLDWALTAAAGSLGSQPVCASALAAFPAWYAGSVRADADALISRTAWPHVTAGPIVASNAKSALLSHLPASTLAVLDVHELGSIIRNAVDSMKTCADPSQAAMLKQLDTTIGAFGGWDGITGPIGETAIVFDRVGPDPTGGLLFVPKDRAAADRLVLQLRSLVELSGSGVILTDETYAGATLTVIGGPAISSAATPSIAYVVTDGFVALGVESWVKRVLDTKPADSLASDARFSSALAHVDAEHGTLIYANLAGLLEFVPVTLPLSAADQYRRDVVPNLTPFDAFIATSTVSSNPDRFNVAITVK